MKKNRFKFILAFSALFMTSLCSGQLFEKPYIEPRDQEGTDVVPTPDGGYMVCGYTENNRQDDMDVLIFKTDNSGNIVWRDTISGMVTDYAHRLTRGADGDYYIVGHSRSFGGGDYDILLVKIDVNGVEKYRKKYGSNGNEYGMDIVATADGNYVIVASSKNSGSPDHNFNLRKIRPDGSEVWSKTYGGSGHEYANSVKLCADGGFIMIGQSYSYGSSADAYIVRTDSTGTEKWFRTYGGPNADEGLYLTVNTDNSMTFVVRDSVSFTRDIDVDVYKVNATGDTVVWKQTYGGSKKDTPKMIQPTADGGYIIAAISRSIKPNPDMWILKLNSAGAMVWESYFGGANNEHCYTMRELSDGSFIGVGKTQSYGPDLDTELLKINSQGTLVVGLNELSAHMDNSFYPNPGNGTINFNVNARNIKIFNALGENVPYDQLSQDRIELKVKTPGLYVISMEQENMTMVRKMIIK